MKSYSKILLALGCGAAVGSLLGVLFAPGKGSETRKRVYGSSHDLTDWIKNISGNHKPVVHHHNGKTRVKAEYGR